VGLLPYANAGERTDNPKDIQQPQKDGYDDHGIQYGLDGSGHGDEPINDHEKNAHHDKDGDNVNQWHELITSLFA
jgi:hypothetical protein